jgi:6-phosphogluconate dehydrogenase (decarboxylating)
VSGARSGACFMVGGRDAPVRVLRPVLRKLAVPGGYVPSYQSRSPGSRALPPAAIDS